MKKPLENLGDIPEYLLENFKDIPVFSFRNKNETTHIYPEEFLRKSQKIAITLFSLGIQKGDIILTLITPSHYWNYLDTAISMCGAIHLPFFQNNIELHTALSTLNIKLSIVDKEIQTELKQISFSEILMSSKNNSGTALLQKVSVVPDDPAYIIYSFNRESQLCPYVISHSQLITIAFEAAEILQITPGYSYLSLLPIAKVYERSSQIAHMLSGWTIKYATATAFPSAIIKDAEIEACSIVPSLLKYPFRVPDNLVKKYNNRHSCMYESADKSDFKSFFGEKLKYIICGGAPLDDSLENTYSTNGITIFNGYGLTQTAGAISVSSFNAYKKGSAGKLLKNASFKIGENNELFLKGTSLSQYCIQNGNLEIILNKDSFLPTGDIGYIDEDGFVFIQGNLRTIFKMQNGQFLNTIKHEEFLMKTLNMNVMLCRNSDGDLHLFCEGKLTDNQRKNLKQLRLVDFATYKIKSLSENCRIPLSRPYIYTNTIEDQFL
ncbi:MAG: AMP-binding protein [Bacteroidales bacterium]|nr:AMP-binding protein [Bacteroidales bacterium]